MPTPPSIVAEPAIVTISYDAYYDVNADDATLIETLEDISDTINSWFKRAGLTVSVEDFANNEEIFQLDIPNRKAKDGRFRLWHGTDSSISLVDADRKLRQLILRVQEPERNTSVTVKWPAGCKDLKEVAAKFGDKYVTGNKEAKTATVKTTISGAARRFLLGVDEGHLFVCQLPIDAKITTVADAHAALIPKEVRTSNGRLVSGVRRQGEWFFRPLSSAETKWLMEAWPTAHNDTDIDSAFDKSSSESHHVEQRMDLRDNDWLDSIAKLPKTLEDRVLVRGSVSHVRHKTINCKEWHVVYQSLEEKMDPDGIGFTD